MAAMLATLEGYGSITLNDLFDVNDFLGVKYFGVDKWNQIKDFACKLTESAAKSPTLFCIANLDKDYTKPSSFACELLGFDDEMGVCAMGSTAWNTLKCRLSDELLGWSIKSVGSAIKSGASKVASGAKKVATTAINAPNKVINYTTTKTPLKYTPAAYIYNKTLKKANEAATDATKSAVQKATDTGSKVIYYAATKTPLKYTPAGYIVKKLEEAKEEAGVTSKGTANVYETDAEVAEKAQKAAAAAARAAAAATEKQAMQLKAAKEKKAANEVIQQQQAEQTATKQALDVMENRATSKYYPIIFAGVFGLLALSILKK